MPTKDPKISYNTIKQYPSESFVDFVERLQIEGEQQVQLAVVMGNNDGTSASKHSVQTNHLGPALSPTVNSRSHHRDLHKESNHGPGVQQGKRTAQGRDQKDCYHDNTTTTTISNTGFLL